MTALTPTAAALVDKASTRRDDQPPREGFPPSASEEEAKTRFVSALNRGVDDLLGRGHGRERASAKLLDEIAGGCSPDEEEIFQTMELLGLSLEDATKVITVSSAFRKAKSANGGSTAGAIDELTSRLNLAGLSIKGERSRSPSPSPSATSIASTPSSSKLSGMTRNESAESFHARHPPASALAKKGQRPVRAVKSHGQQGRGRKRALAEKNAPESSLADDVPEAPPAKGAAATADPDSRERTLFAKLSKAEVTKKPKSSSARAKSPEGPRAARGKRTSAAAVLRSAEEPQANKRPRTRSQTEESIPAIMS